MGIKKKRDNMYKLRVPTILITTLSLFVSCRTSSNRSSLKEDALVSHAGYFENCKNTKTCYNYNELFLYARALMSQKAVRTVLKEKFPDALQVDNRTAEILDMEGNVRDFSEHQLLNMMQQLPSSLRSLKKILVDNIEDPDQLSEIFDKLIEKFNQEHGSVDGFIDTSPPGAPFALTTPEEIPSFANIELYVNHPLLIRGSLKTANPNFVTETMTGDKVNDLSKVVIDFIEQATKEIVINVYDFNHSDIAAALIAAADRGVSIRVGVDIRTSTQRPNAPHPVNPLNVMIVKDMREAGIHVTSVNSTGLNHQKIIARDWSKKSKGAVLFSSANFTASGIHPMGDVMDGKIESKNFKYALPNANHMITLNSDVGAALINHELSKIIGVKDQFSTKFFDDLGLSDQTTEGGKYFFQLRGSELPFSGSYKLIGSKNEEINITFTPGGALKSVNQLILSHMISTKKGSIRMAQFAFSSPHVAQALIERIAKDKRNDIVTDFLSVGDKPFALSWWSQFLTLSDLTKSIPEDLVESSIVIGTDISSVSSKVYFDRALTNLEEAPSNIEILDPASSEKLRNRTCVAPYTFGDRKVPLLQRPTIRDARGNEHPSIIKDVMTIEDNTEPGQQGELIKLSGKIHHKLIKVGNYSSVGSSFNFSKGAESNSEQIVIVKSSRMSNMATGMVNYLAKESFNSVYGQAVHKNGYAVEDAVNGKILLGIAKDLSGNEFEIRATLDQAKEYGFVDGSSRDFKCIHEY